MDWKHITGAWKARQKNLVQILIIWPQPIFSLLKMSSSRRKSRKKLLGVRCKNVFASFLCLLIAIIIRIVCGNADVFFLLYGQPNYTNLLIYQFINSISLVLRSLTFVQFVFIKYEMDKQSYKSCNFRSFYFTYSWVLLWKKMLCSTSIFMYNQII